MNDIVRCPKCGDKNGCLVEDGDTRYCDLLCGHEESFGDDRAIKDIEQAARTTMSPEAQTYYAKVLAANARIEELEQERDAAISEAKALRGIHTAPWDGADLDDYSRGLRESHRSMARTICREIGGEVEGAPTSEVNYLQRLRELVRNEALLEQAAKEVRKLKPIPIGRKTSGSGSRRLVGINQESLNRLVSMFEGTDHER